MVKVSTKNIKKNNGSDYDSLKHSIVKYAIIVLLFVIIFDKLTLLIIFSLYYIYKRLFKNHIEPFAQLNYSSFDTSNNDLSYNTLYSHTYKNSGLNLSSYNNVKIDPTKVLFENNKFLPECCLYNSEYSTSKGCACITPTQQEYLRRRGTNKSASSFIQNNSKYTNLFFSPTLAIQGDPIPFNKYNTNYIVDYQDLSSDKIDEFNSLINKLDNKLINYNPST